MIHPLKILDKGLLIRITLRHSYVGQSAAQKSNLAYINDAGNAIMRVDNSSSLKFGDKRDSVHITSQDLFTVGTVWIADFLHVPFGVRI